MLAKEETYHIQRAKKRWAISGDRNTAYFHKAIVKRNTKNRISHLINPDGSHSTTPEQLADTLIQYFTNIFSSQSSNHQPLNIMQLASPIHAHPPSQQQAQQTHQQAMQEDGAHHDSDIFRYTYSTPNLQEIHDIIQEMRSNATPGPDGLNAAFYKSAWSWVKDDILRLITDFYSHSYMPNDINQTFITLIPKKNNPTVPQDYRPISLCNVAYKIVSKSLANRLKNHLPNFVSQAQSAFIAHRHISSNIIVTQEIIHSFDLKSWHHQAFLLKIDLAKAFDRLEWNFILAALRRLGLREKFISLIHACIYSPTFSVLVNDEPSGHFCSQRGLRQGCPLSPYLFVIAINDLSIRLQEALQHNNLSRVTLGPGCPPIHSFLFADDLILCGKASLEEAQQMKNILYEFYTNSGQCPNLQKSSIYFSKHVPQHLRQQLKRYLPCP